MEVAKNHDNKMIVCFFFLNINLMRIFHCDSNNSMVSLFSDTIRGEYIVSLKLELIN